MALHLKIICKAWKGVLITLFNPQNEEELRKIYQNVQSKWRKIEKDLSKYSIKTKKNWERSIQMFNQNEEKLKKDLSKCSIKTKKNWEISIQMFNQNKEKLRKIYPNVQSKRRKIEEDLSKCSIISKQLVMGRFTLGKFSSIFREYLIFVNINNIEEFYTIF
jgi:hypothetical protein